ncbi:magnesium chelatase [Selenomonas sp. oral taxon 920]|uniref:VWA domain-containing protein n=1 Tax=Selenomonas sp. oral taxon 920 TaxID=1884263 RepID=UPI000840EBAF|nr:VWA domain-containing protein [Selenomonas sp. oral taxon 920]AOH47635.1 magnesium chelatase [Selenomonas sp. oral taxon 920]
MDTPRYPLTAVVGQEHARCALSIALINPRAGGLLISGTRGTAKSVLVRAAAPFTPAGKITELPLGASEDMIFGTIDMETALQKGERRLRHGLLHRARNTFLYMDEANLLREDILSTVLKCAGDGSFRLERDGLSFIEEVSYTPVGTMDPAEGTLRPALLDSFGMFVTMEEEGDAAQRSEIAARVLAYERDPASFRASYAAQEEAFGAMISRARALLPRVGVPSAILHFAAACAARACCVGNHAEIYLTEAARAIAALAGRPFVMPADVEEAAEFVLVHRMSRPQEEQQPPDDGNAPEQGRNEMPDEPQESPPPQDDGGAEASHESPSENEPQDSPQDGADDPSRPEDADAGEDDRVAAPLENVMARLSLLSMTMRAQVGKSGKRDIVQTHTADGRCLRTELPRSGGRLDLALSATLRAAAPYQRARQGTQTVVIRPEDVRVWVRAKRSAANILFLVDASGSMGARERMRMVKGAILALLQEAYQKRDRVGLIAFRRDRAETLLPMTRSVELAEKQLRDLPMGGRTPLAEGLACALQTLRELERRGSEKTVLILITDGRTNTARDGDDGVQRALRAAEEIAGTQALTLVLDTERGVPRVGAAPEIARRMEARYYTLEQLSAEGVLEIVRASRRMQG